jgi:hypothetical protein
LLSVVAPRFLQVLGVSPAPGHDFSSDDEHFHRYVPSDRFWREHFHADPMRILREE